MSQVKWNVEHLVHVDSTNTWLAQRAREGARAHLAVYCDFQSAGRGRLEREWHAPAGSSLLCSALVEAPAAPVAPQWVVVAAALAVADALEESTGRRPDLKWPNDVLYGESKVAGLLAEVVACGASSMIVVGLGLNLVAVDPAFQSATTVLAATATSLEPRDALTPYLAALDRRRSQLDSSAGVRELSRDYEGDLVTLGQRVRVELAQGSLVGTAVGVDDAGALVVDTESGARVFNAGDVVHVRGESS